MGVTLEGPLDLPAAAHRHGGPPGRQGAFHFDSDSDRCGLKNTRACVESATFCSSLFSSSFCSYFFFPKVGIPVFFSSYFYATCSKMVFGSPFLVTLTAIKINQRFASPASFWFHVSLRGSKETGYKLGRCPLGSPGLPAGMDINRFHPENWDECYNLVIEHCGAAYVQSCLSLAEADTIGRKAGFICIDMCVCVYLE